MSPRQILYVSALCGVGKTYCLCQYISKDREHNYLLVAASVELANQTLNANYNDPVLLELCHYMLTEYYYMRDQIALYILV